MYAQTAAAMGDDASSKRQMPAAAIDRKRVVQATAAGEDVQVTFGDGAIFSFHALWLRDACRDEGLVKSAAGERILHKIPMQTLATTTPAALVMTTSLVTPENGGVRMEWSDGAAGTFEGGMLRAYAPSAAMPVGKSPPTEEAEIDVSWLAPYTGLPGAPAPLLEQLRLCYGPAAPDPGPAYVELQYEHVMTEAGNLELLRTVTRDGAVKIVGAPNPSEPQLHELADFCFNGLQVRSCSVARLDA